MDELDLGQAARVLWLQIGAGATDTGTLGKRKSAEFPTLMKAVTFVMEELGEAERATAVIAIEQLPGTLSVKDIEKIHLGLTQG